MDIATPQKWLYKATVRDIVDGDTADFDVDLFSILSQIPVLDAEYLDIGFKLHIPNSLIQLIRESDQTIFLKDERFRFARINAPEKKGASAQLGKKSLDFVAEKMPVGSKVSIETTKVRGKTRQDKYGRYLGTIILADGTILNETLLKRGFAVPYRYQ